MHVGVCVFKIIRWCRCACCVRGEAESVQLQLEALGRLYHEDVASFVWGTVQAVSKKKVQPTWAALTLTPSTTS